MSLAAGTISLVSNSANEAQLAATAATGGTGPYTQQWYKSQTTGFSPGGGNIIAGATGLTLDDSGLIPGETWFYKVVYTDTGNSNVTATSAQFANTLLGPSQSPNQFDQSTIVGVLDLKVGPTNVLAVEIDDSVTTPIFAGTPVKIASGNTGGALPKVVPCTANSDVVFGFIAYDIKSQAYGPGDRAELAQKGSCMFLYATGAINRGAQVTLVTAGGGVNGVQAANSGDEIVGYAYDSAAAYGDLIRVMISSPSFQTA